MAEGSGQIKMIVKGLERLAEKSIQKMAINITGQLTEDTPVDTGWAANNWVPSVGKPFEQGEDYTPNERDEKFVRLPAAQAQVQQGRSSLLAGYKLSRGRVFIVNNVTYINKLNAGHSMQHPVPGFVQRAIDTGVISSLGGSK